MASTTRLGRRRRPDVARRPVWRALAHALALAAALLAPPAAHALRAPTLALAPRADAGHEMLALGATEWARQRLTEAGLAASPGIVRGAGLEASRSAALPDAAAMQALAAGHGATQGLVLDLRVRDGDARVRLLVADLRACMLVGSARAEGPLASLGETLAEATRSLAAQEGLEAPSLEVPALADLDRYGRALAHLEAGRPSDAWLELGTRLTPTTRALQEQVGATRTDTLPLGERARLAVVRGEAESARLWLRAHLADTRESALVLAAAASAEQIAEWERALSLHERALALDPGSAAAAVGRARALAQLGRGADLLALLATPFPAGADPAELEPAATLPGLDPATLARLHLRIAQLAAARFDAPRATEHFAAAIAADPAVEPEAQRGEALLYAALGELAPARQAAERAAALGSADAPVLETLAAARRRAGDAPGARVAFEQAHALAPERSAPLVGLAGIASEGGDSGRAVELLREAVAVEPHEPTARVQLAGLLRSLGDVDGALAVLEGADPEAGLLRRAAALRLERGETGPAATLLARAAVLEPDDGALLGELADVEEKRGDGAAAAELRARAERQGEPGRGGITLAAGRAAEEGDAAADGGDRSAAASFADLVATFPTELPGRERPIETVALLAPARDGASEGWRRWLRPRRVDPEAVGRALAAALADRYQVVAPAEIPPELEAADQAALRSGAGDAGSVARVNVALGSDAVLVARVSNAGAGTLRIELRMGVGDLDATVRRFRNEARMPGAVAELSQWNPSALALAGLALLLAVLPVLRGWGGLVVGIQYASLGKGYFSIKLSRRSEPASAGREASGRDARFLRRMRMMGRYQRRMVDRETHFKLLPARRYFVQVHGLLEDAASQKVVGNYFEEQVVVVARGRTARLDFDFRPKECAVEVTIFDGEQPAPRALVALRGQPASVRYARGGRVVLALAPGRHGILVGAGDRVLEREVSIEGFAPRAVPFELHDESALLFSGCAEAVEPYLQGQLEVAADALERAGDAAASARIRGEHFVARGEVQQAAKSYQEAGRFEDAAALAAEGTDERSAAELYEQAGNLEKAAEAWRRAGEPARAAAIFEDQYRYEDALDCWRAAGHTEKVCDLCEKLARNYEAAELALELGDADRAIRNLQMVELRDVVYVDACRLLARIFSERGEHELAMQKLDEAVTMAGGAEAAPLELLAEHGQALERAGRLADAIAVWEAVRARDFHWPEAGPRLDSLRQALEAERTVAEARETIVRGAAAESRYELLGEIGRGGMGVVFKARDRRLGRIVALKRLPENLRNHPTAVRLFLREARAAAALNHRNIVTLYDADQEGDVYFLTMEFLDGFPLHEILARRGKLLARDVARIGGQAAVGLEYAHAHGVVHRDIKTSNLFFTRDKVVKIMDFGLAKMAEEVRRAATVVGGTPYYMAPEQAAGQDVDHRADLYAFGATLYELLAGEVPFRQGDIARHHRETPLPEVREKAPDTPAELVELLEALMAKDPAGRPASAGEVAARLQRIAKSLSA